LATPIGTNSLNSVSRRFIMPQVTDNVYRSNPLFFRLNTRNKKRFDGGFQIELPLLWTQMSAGGPYSGYDLLDVQPSDTIKNAAFDLKYYYVPVSIDGGTIIRSNSPEAVVNMLGQLFAGAEAQMAENLGAGIWANNSNAKSLDGIVAAVDNGAVAATYGGLSRASNTFWNAQVATATPPLTFLQLQQVFGNCTEGGRRPTIIITTQQIYNILWALSIGTAGGYPTQTFPAMAGGEDSQLAQAGFSNILFNGVPILVDSHCPAGNIFLLNEEYMYLYVNNQRDFYLKDFQSPVNQDAYTSMIYWAGNLVFSNLLRQGKITGVTA
jgi:hypothetical protein